MRNSIRSVLVAGVVVLGLAACSDDDDEVTLAPQTVAQVRVVHASPDAPNVDVLVDDDVALEDVPYGAASAFLEVPSGTRRVRVRAAGGTESVIDANVPVVGGGSYTVLATGLLAGIQPVIATNDVSDPPVGWAKLRVIHAAPFALGVDVYAGAPGANIEMEEPVLTNVAFRSVSDYLTLPPGTYQIRVTPTGSTPTDTTGVLIDANVTLAAGQVRTVVARDAVGGGIPLSALVLADKN